jgi:hypothetical protein
MKAVMIILLSASISFAVSVFDDFAGGIGGWTARCGSAAWSSSEGLVTCQTGNTCSALVFPGAVSTQDGSISVYGSGYHTFGVVARLDNLNTGVYAYVSVDHNVARIRKVANGAISTIYSSLNYDFPSGDYMLVFTCEGPDMSLSIEHVQSSQTWLLEASSGTAVQTGEWGLAAGETTAWWDWVELQYEITATEGETSGPIPQPAIHPQLNPFTGSVMITVEGGSPGSTLEVFDLSGRAVQNIDVSSGAAMFTPDLPGIYLARLSGTAGAQVVKLVCLP